MSDLSVEIALAWVIIGWVLAAVALRDCFDDVGGAVISTVLIIIDGAVAGPFMLIALAIIEHDRAKYLKPVSFGAGTISGKRAEREHKL